MYKWIVEGPAKRDKTCCLQQDGSQSKEHQDPDTQTPVQILRGHKILHSKKMYFMCVVGSKWIMTKRSGNLLQRGYAIPSLETSATVKSYLKDYPRVS